ncbi:hypothetical protein GDO81_022870 [Engystomops pustulosus]|uniref:Secreted protein n=1 Tax=Engystomops pustulosus TaxID=76066 RepID=A0AAV6YMC0_ENGPU|nr:hypothetical protein GDO81_022870 [Engystomops pustulosus]
MLLCTLVTAGLKFSPGLWKHLPAYYIVNGKYALWWHYGPGLHGRSTVYLYPLAIACTSSNEPNAIDSEPLCGTHCTTCHAGNAIIISCHMHLEAARKEMQRRT